MSELCLLTEARTVSVCFCHLTVKHFSFLLVPCLFPSSYTFIQSYSLNWSIQFTYYTHTHIGKVDISAGTYDYHFECMLPSDSPSSIEARSGSVRYVVRVIVDNTVLTNEIFKRALNIIRPLDLNTDLLYRVIHAIHIKIHALMI